MPSYCFRIRALSYLYALLYIVRQFRHGERCGDTSRETSTLELHPRCIMKQQCSKQQQQQRLLKDTAAVYAHHSISMYILKN
jgi:hypothetical protein